MSGSPFVRRGAAVVRVSGSIYRKAPAIATHGGLTPSAMGPIICAASEDQQRDGGCVQRTMFAGFPAAAVIAAASTVAAAILAPLPGVSRAGDPAAAPNAAAPQSMPDTPPAFASAAPPAPISVPPPLPLGDAPDLDLVFSAQVVGWLEPCG